MKFLNANFKLGRLVWLVSLIAPYLAPTSNTKQPLTMHSAYLLCTAAFQLFYGKIYTFFTIKWVFLAALVIFEIGSAVCGAAPSSTAFIIGRAVAGLGSAGLFSGAMLIVADAVPLRKRPAYMGAIGGMYGIASVAGPLMVCPDFL